MNKLIEREEFINAVRVISDEFWPKILKARDRDFNGDSTYDLAMSQRYSN